MSKGKIKAARSKNTITLIYNKESINIQKEKRPEEFERIAKLLIEYDEEKLIAMFKSLKSLKERIEDFTSGVFQVEGDQVKLKGTDLLVPKPVVKKLLELEKAGEDFMPLIRFWKKLMQNPSANSREQLYSFILANNMSITEQGDIVMEKGVKQKAGSFPGHLVDIYSGVFDNSIGMVVEMDRSKVEDDKNKTCSRGLHAAPPSYVRKIYSNDILIELIVNPRDVVSVPVDYNSSKVRLCRYQVMGYSPKSIRKEQVVKLSDFIQDIPQNVLDAHKLGIDKASMSPSSSAHIESTRSTKGATQIKGTKEGSLQIETSLGASEIEGMTAQQIIDYVKNKTGQVIELSLKNKSGIQRKAVELLNAFNIEHSTKMINEINEPHQTKEQAEKALEGLSASAIIDYMKENCNEDLSHINVKNKARIYKEALTLLMVRTVMKEENVPLILNKEEALPKVREFLNAGKKLDAVKYVKDVLQLGLKEAKEWVDSIDVADSSTNKVTKAVERKEEAKVVVLSKMNKNELVKLAKEKFNESVGGRKKTVGNIRAAVSKLFSTAGYEIK